MCPALAALVPLAVRFLQSRENLPVTAPATERLPADGDGNAALVPEAEPLVKPFRDRYDPSAAAEVPAHITLLYPFKHPDEVDQTVLGDLNQCFHRCAPFRFSLAPIRRFPDAVLCLPHQIAGKAAQVAQVDGVFGGDDEAELVPVAPTSRQEGLQARSSPGELRDCRSILALRTAVL